MKNPDSKLALKWACTERTIRRWRKDGAPLHNAKAMATWLASRQRLPPGTEALLSKQPASAFATSTTAASEASSDEGSTGAPAALKRLEAAEKASYGLLQKAIKSKNPSEIKLGRQTWLAIGNQLRQYDRQVARDLRDAGELVPRSQIECHIRRFCHYMHLASMRAATRMVRELTECPDRRAVFGAFTEQLWHNQMASLAALCAMQSKIHAPVAPWFMKAASEGQTAFANPDVTVKETQQFIEAVFDQVVEVATENRIAKLHSIIGELKAEAAAPAAKVETVTVPAVTTQPAVETTPKEKEEMTDE